MLFWSFRFRPRTDTDEGMELVSAPVLENAALIAGEYTYITLENSSLKL